MAFIRKKKTSAGRTVYQVVRSYRDGHGRVRQKVLASLMYDSTIAEAIATLRRRITDIRAMMACYSREDSLRRITMLEQKIAVLEAIQLETGLA